MRHKRVELGDNFGFFQNADASNGFLGDDEIRVRLLWSDVPYGTGKIMRQQGNSYKDFSDTDYVLAGIGAWMPVVAANGTVVICCDYRLVPDIIRFMTLDVGWIYRGEVIWEFGLGRPRASWWPVRHNNLLTFTKTESSGLFDPDAIPRVKRLAPKPGYPDDKPSGSVWDFTLSNTHPQRVGYPNQKPLEIIRPFIRAHTGEGDVVADPFAGSGSVGHAALELNRSFIINDLNPDAYKLSKKRIKVLWKEKRK